MKELWRKNYLLRTSLAHFICSLKNYYVDTFLLKPEILSLLLKQFGQIQNFATKTWSLQTIYFGSGKSAWKVNKDFLASIEICLHRYFLESRWNELIPSFTVVLLFLRVVVLFFQIRREGCFSHWIAPL